ncbi:MAG: homocysteine S-methyltransferase family protein, partial [Clostridia bacterium]|nr:homocysteine S-methyltransferase family protein [Clostridia bacterium]
MKNILDLLKEKRLFFDGGMGTLLQSKGLGAGEKPEVWNIEKSEIIEGIHREYFAAGANIVKTNTFGINKDKFDNFAELIEAGISCAVRAKDGKSERFIAFDMGPTGRMLKPL